MAIRSIAQLKTWFETGDKPTQEQFWDWLDSFIHKDDGIAIENVDGLEAALLAKADQSLVQQIINILFPFRVDLAANGSFVLPAGYSIRKVDAQAAGNSVISLSTVPGLKDLVEDAELDAGVATALIFYLRATADTTVYAEGITSNTTFLIYRDTLTHSNPI